MAGNSEGRRVQDKLRRIKPPGQGTMMQLRTKLSLFNLLSKVVFAGMFLILMPYIIQRINLRQVDNNLIQKREQVIAQISDIGIEPFIQSDSSDAFGSYNILKEEFISLERIDNVEDLNYIDVAPRLIEGEEIEYRVLNYSFVINDQKYLLEIGKSLESIRYTEKNTRRVMWVFLIFIIILTFITDLEYTNLLLKPLEKIKNKLKRISDPSHFDNSRVKTSTYDFQRLDSALNELMDHINALFKKEKEITVNISHELMTPVSVMRSKLENILLKKDLDPETEVKIEESLKILHRLQSLISSLLLIARIESHQYLRDESFSLNDLLLEITGEIKPVAADAGVDLTSELPEDFIFKSANRSLIFSMLFNIVNNAVKNTPKGGVVKVRGILRENGYLLSISDTGRGLNEVQKQSLFERFKMRDPASREGTGIGLAISKTIADFHNIEVSVSSESGKGTVFSFLFPANS